MSDDPRITSFFETIWPGIPADDPISAIILSKVASPNVIHFTKANEVKENTNVMHAAAAIDGINKGNQR